jgi:hypothetical protein
MSPAVISAKGAAYTVYQSGDGSPFSQMSDSLRAHKALQGLFQIPLVVPACGDPTLGIDAGPRSGLSKDDIEVGPEILDLFVVEVVDHFKDRPTGWVWPPAGLFTRNALGEGTDDFRVVGHSCCDVFEIHSKFLSAFSLARKTSVDHLLI